MYLAAATVLSRSTPVTHDAALISLNDRIPEAENRGADAESHAFLDSILAPVFAFRRASGALTDRAGYLNGLASGGDRVVLGSYDITPAGEYRAIVSCRIQMTVGNVLSYGWSPEYDSCPNA
jgi:hypothetical protein